MADKENKPTFEEIVELANNLETDFYKDLHKDFREDERYFDLDFKGNLGLPTDFQKDGVVLTTARDMVLTAVDHTEVTGARVFVAKQQRGMEPGKALDDYREMVRKMCVGYINMTNQESQLSPWRSGATHFWTHGLTCMRTLYAEDAWPAKPSQADMDGDKYKDAMEEWRWKADQALPIILTPINPIHVMPDPYTNQPRFVIEKYRKLQEDVKNKWPDWGNPKGVGRFKEIEWLSYWDGKYFCYLADGEPVMSIEGGVAPHNYGFLPYRFAFTGLGTEAADNKISKKAVGLLRYSRGLLESESAFFSMYHIITKRGAWPTGFLEGENAEGVQEVSLKYGEFNRLPPGVQVKWMEKPLPPGEVQVGLHEATNRLERHAAPSSMLGVSSERGSGYHKERILMQEAARKYAYGRDAFRFMTQGLLVDMLRIAKYRVPDNIRMWSSNPEDEFDEEIDREKLKEPFRIGMEFSAVDELDEYQRDENLRQNVAQGIMSRRKAIEKGKPGSDPNEELTQMAIEQYGSASPGLAQVLDQMITQQLQMELGRRIIAEEPAMMPGTRA